MEVVELIPVSEDLRMHYPKSQREQLPSGGLSDGEGWWLISPTPTWTFMGLPLWLQNNPAFHWWVIKWKGETSYHIFLITACLDVPWNISNPANVPILHYSSPVGGVEKGPGAGSQEICVSAQPLLDWATWAIHWTFLSFILFFFQKMREWVYCPQCLLALKRPLQVPQVLSFVSLLLLTFWI